MGGSGSLVRVGAVDAGAEVPVARLADTPSEPRAASRRSVPMVRGPLRAARPHQGRMPGRPGVGPEPVGPGWASSRRTPAGARSARVAGRARAARPVPVRPVPARPAPRRAGSAGARGRRVSTVARFVVVAVLAAVAVGGLGLLSDAARAARAPETTGLVRVHPGESLWQVARRVAPSADPGVVAARIVELNGLGSPSVRGGEVLVSPIG